MADGHGPKPISDVVDVEKTFSRGDSYVARGVVTPLRNFVSLETSGAVLLLVATIIALIWVNSSEAGAELYHKVFDTPMLEWLANLGGFSIDGLGHGADHGADAVGHGTDAANHAFGGVGLFAAAAGGAASDALMTHLPGLTLHAFINDALMAIFFFVVGLEIKRAFVDGDLGNPKNAVVPVFGALGGMIVPAAIFVIIVVGFGGADFDLFGAGLAKGWGIPMATDIAFAVGLMALVSKKIPTAAKLFLLTLAIVDDLAAILVIAFVYTDTIKFGWLAFAFVVYALMLLAQRSKVQATGVYVTLAFFVWLGFLESGVHATLAGVIIAFATPWQSFYETHKYGIRARTIADRVDAVALRDGDPNNDLDHHELEIVDSELLSAKQLADRSLDPLTKWEFAITPWTAYLIIPLFALANAGVVIPFNELGSVAADSVTQGVFFGLLVGKPLGVTLFVAIAVFSGLGQMPKNTTWRHIFGLGLLAGIGFTVAIFVAGLAYPNEGITAGVADSAKIGILAASTLAAVFGYLFLKSGPDIGDEGRTEGSQAFDREGPDEMDPTDEALQGA